MSFKKSRGFTLLELLVVVTLLLIVFSIVGLTFVNNIRGIRDIQAEINNQARDLSLLNVLSKQLFARYNKLNENIIVERDRLSFYTYYPVFFEGAVRAEYIFEPYENNKVRVIYEESPYVDGKLGVEGVKKQFIGVFERVALEPLLGDRWLENYRGKNFPIIYRLILDDSTYYITICRRIEK